MSIKDLRKEELLDGDIDLPDVTGDFHITVDGVPLCLVDRALVGASNSECQFSSLNSSIADCLKWTVVFPAAMVGVFLGKCPNDCAGKAA